MPPATQIRIGNIVKIGNDLFSVMKIHRITPGKGNAIVQTVMRNVKTGTKTEKRFRSNENVDTVSVLSRTMQYLYEGDGVYHFMDTDNYEQYELSGDLLGEALNFMIPETTYTVDLYEGSPIGIELPPRVTLTITQTDPGQKGSSGKVKPATTNSGLIVKVPLFLEEGDSIVVNTETHDYVERA